ncbi:MAG: DUF4232 domain-containing protein [Candidatus Dormibacteria bacterium]
MNASRKLVLVALCCIACTLAGCASTSTPPSTKATTSTVPLSASCTPHDLVASPYDYAHGAGMGSVYIELTNITPQPCTIGGYPTLAFERAGSQPVTVVPIKGIEKEPASTYLTGSKAHLPAQFTLMSSATASFVYEEGIEPVRGATCINVSPLFALAGTVPAINTALHFNDTGNQQYCGGYILLSPIEPGVTWDLH